jgi:antitoxin ParD1/3/4
MLVGIAGGQEMTVTLTHQHKDLVERLVASGQYEDAEQVIGQALHLLEEHERLQQLRAKIQIGLDELDRGEGIEVTPEFWDELDREVDEAILRGDEPDPDVCP